MEQGSHNSALDHVFLFATRVVALAFDVYEWEVFDVAEVHLAVAHHFHLRQIFFEEFDRIDP